MKTVNKLSIITAWVMWLMVASLWLWSCRKNGHDQTSRKIIVDSVTLHNATTTTTRIEQVRVGAIIRINGAGFLTARAVYMNGVKVTVNPNYVTEHNIILLVPPGLPYGKDITNDAVRNTIRIVTAYDDFTFHFSLLGPLPVINDVSHSMPKAGEKLIIYGTNLRDLDSVVLPGHIVFTRGGFQTSNDHTSVSLIVPDNANLAAGSIYIHGDNGSAYSYNYMNRKECVFIQKFSNDAAVPGGAGDCYERAYNFGTTISANQTSLLPATGDGHKNPETYRQVPATPSDAAIGAMAGGFDFRTCPALTSVLQTSNGAVTASMACSDLAVQFDVYIPVEWSSGFIRFEWFKGNGSYRYDYASWAQHGSVTPVKMNGWQTVTIPLSEFKSLNGKTLQYLLNQAGAKGGFFAFINGAYTDAGGKVFHAAIIKNFQLSFGNFRIVPYAKR